MTYQHIKKKIRKVLNKIEDVDRVIAHSSNLSRSLRVDCYLNRCTHIIQPFLKISEITLFRRHQEEKSKYEMQLSQLIVMYVALTGDHVKLAGLKREFSEIISLVIGNDVVEWMYFH